LLQLYPWPGNIRELQNVIERSMILCETEIFPIDEAVPKERSDRKWTQASSHHAVNARPEKSYGWQATENGNSKHVCSGA
jgi:DNA-binding NtrC family response regulator